MPPRWKTLSLKLNKPSLLIESYKAIDAMQISAKNRDVQGDLYEYLLEKLNTAGQNGQFRTPILFPRPSPKSEPTTSSPTHPSKAQLTRRMRVPATVEEFASEIWAKRRERGMDKTGSVPF